MSLVSQLTSSTHSLKLTQPTYFSSFEQASVDVPVQEVQEDPFPGVSSPPEALPAAYLSYDEQLAFHCSTHPRQEPTPEEEEDLGPDVMPMTNSWEVAMSIMGAAQKSCSSDGSSCCAV